MDTSFNWFSHCNATYLVLVIQKYQIKTLVANNLHWFCHMFYQSSLRHFIAKQPVEATLREAA